MNPFHTSNDIIPTNSSELKCVTATAVPTTSTDQMPPTTNESQLPQKLRRPTDLLPLQTNTVAKSEPTEQLTKLVNECRISSCSRCNGNCVCDKSETVATANAPPTSNCSASLVMDNGTENTSAKRVQSNTATSVAQQSPPTAAAAATTTADAATHQRGAGSLKSSMNKCVGPTPSPPHAPIFVNRFPNNYPTILPPHIR